MRRRNNNPMKLIFTRNHHVEAIYETVANILDGGEISGKAGELLVISVE